MLENGITQKILTLLQVDAILLLQIIVMVVLYLSVQPQIILVILEVLHIEVQSLVQDVI